MNLNLNNFLKLFDFDILNNPIDLDFFDNFFSLISSYYFLSDCWYLFDFLNNTINNHFFCNSCLDKFLGSDLDRYLVDYNVIYRVLDIDRDFSVD